MVHFYYLLTNTHHSMQVMSVGISVAKVGFYGRNYERLWCQTHIETVR